VVYDAPLPAVYADFADEPDAGFAWCWRVGPLGAEGDVVALGWNDEGGADDAPAALPHALDVLRFLLSGDPSLQWRGDGTAWHWRRNA